MAINAPSKEIKIPFKCSEFINSVVLFWTETANNDFLKFQIICLWLSNIFVEMGTK